LQLVLAKLMVTGDIFVVVSVGIEPKPSDWNLEVLTATPLQPLFVVYAQRYSFRSMIFFTFTSSGCLVFIPAFFFHAISVYPLLRGPLFSWSNPSDQIPFSLLYIKPLFPINKQLSIDSFLDCDSLHWDFCSPPSFLQHSQFPS